MFRCVAPDMRGYGDSDKPAGIENYHVSMLADDVKNLVKGNAQKKKILSKLKHITKPK